ncbi:MAG: alpha/beta fold hydrolase [Deltaproteobacteria bacterium]|nr:alpha/beta fold hydrolase [Deltaproteobacteria bacterium]
MKPPANQPSTTAHQPLSAAKKIFVHGWATDSRVWREFIKDPSRTAGGPARPAGGGEDAVAVNLPGHGDWPSGHDNQPAGGKKWDSPTFAPAIEALLGSAPDSIGIGWSLGGEILMHLASTNAVRFRGLILVSTTPSFIERDGFPWAQKKARVKKMLADMGKNPAETLKRFYALNFTEEEFLTARAKGFLKLYSGHPQSALNYDYDGLTLALKALMDADLRDGLRKITVPTLIMHGSLDNVCPIGAAHYLKENITGATLRIFEGAGHAPFITRPEEFSKAVSGFTEGI